MYTNNFIEFRVYLREDTENGVALQSIADSLQQTLIDIVSDSDSPREFTQDVTYEIKVRG